MRGAETVDGDAVWTSQLGAALSEDDVARLLDRPAAVVRRDPGLLRVPNRDGPDVYPVVQFDRRAPLTGITDVVAVLAPVVATPLTTAAWLTAPNGLLGGERPVDALRWGRPPACCR